MTEKRFRYVEFTKNVLSFDDNGVCRFFNEQDFEDWLNELHEENEQLKQQLKIYKNDGLETLEDLERAYENNKKALNNIERLEEENKELKEQLKDCTKKAKEEIRKQREENAIRWANIGR